MRGDGTKVLGASAIMVRSQAAPHGLPTRFRQVAVFRIPLATPVARTDAVNVSESGWTGLLRAFWVSSGRAAVARAMPLYFAVLIGASVLFEGSGVRPADVVHATGASLGQRLLLYLAWTLVSLPALRAVLATPSSFFLRTLRWRAGGCGRSGALRCCWRSCPGRTCG